MSGFSLVMFGKKNKIVTVADYSKTIRKIAATYCMTSNTSANATNIVYGSLKPISIHK